MIAEVFSGSSLQSDDCIRGVNPTEPIPPDPLPIVLSRCKLEHEGLIDGAATMVPVSSVPEIAFLDAT